MKKFALMTVFFVFFLVTQALHAQQFDVAFGLGGVSAPSASSVSATSKYFPQSVGGGVYPAFSGDYLIKKRFGVQGEVAWRVGQQRYAISQQPFRPIFFDFNGIWIPELGKHTAAELMAGIGAEDVRFYGRVNCNFFSGCTNYSSVKHFMGHFGGGVRFYVKGNIFVRPEVHLYLVRNNFEFSSGRAIRYAGSVGYTFGRE